MKPDDTTPAQTLTRILVNVLLRSLSEEDNPNENTTKEKENDQHTHT